MQQNNGFRRCRRGVAALAGASLVAAALTVSSLPQAAAAPSDPTVINHGVPGIADGYNGTTAAPDGGSYNVGFQEVVDNDNNPTTNRALLVTKSNADGELDESFGTNGRAVIDLVKTFHASVTNNPGNKEQGKGIAVDKLGRLLVIGEVEGDQANEVSAADTDVFVARLHPTGALDASYGTNGGWTRINFGNGVNPDPAVTQRIPDAAGYDIFIRPNQKTIFSVGIGIDSGASRTNRDAGAVQLNGNGTFDTSFGKDGVASIPTPFSDNLRRGLLDTDGSYFTTAYASVGASNQPFISKYTPAGKPDKSWGDDGLATAYPGGKGGFAEAYGITKDADGNYIISAYGYRGGRTGDAANNSVDALLFSLTPDGSLNTKWADKGLLAYHVGPDGNGSQDRHRTHLNLPDGRIVGVGSGGPGVAGGLITVTPPSGAPGEAHPVNLGASGGAFWGVAAIGNGYQIVAAGSGTGDAQLGLLDLTPASSATSLSLAKSTTTFGGANTATVNLKVSDAAAAGKVAVSVDGKNLQTVSVSASGTATVTLPNTLSVGKHTITAEFAAAPGIAGSKASASVSVNKAASKTSLKLSASKIKKSKQATATIKITGTGVPSGYYPTGTVTIHDGSKKIASVKVTAGNKGTVKVKLPKITKKGNHTIKAGYAGNAELKASSATAKLKVTK